MAAAPNKPANLFSSELVSFMRQGTGVGGQRTVINQGWAVYCPLFNKVYGGWLMVDTYQFSVNSFFRIQHSSFGIHYFIFILHTSSFILGNIPLSTKDLHCLACHVDVIISFVPMQFQVAAGQMGNDFSSGAVG